MDLFKALKPHATLSKNGFDLSRKHVFSSKAGQALPCLSVETVPGDHFEIDLTSLSRTETFNTAAFVRGKQRYDFFFVPYSQLWHPFNQFISQRNDKHSTMQRYHTYCPVVRMGDIFRFIKDLCSLSHNPEFINESKDIHGFYIADSVVRILDLLGYGNFQYLLDLNFDSPDWPEIINAFDNKYVNLFRIAAYQHIWYDYYRNKYYDVDGTGGIETTGQQSHYMDYVYAFNFDDLACDNFANSVVSYGSPHTASIGFNRFKQIFQMRYVQWKKDLFTSALPSQQFGAVSAVDITGKNIISDFKQSTTQQAEVASTNHIVPGSLYPARGTSESTWSIPSAFDVLTLRKAEALQAWKQATLRAGNMTDDSFKAHFGVEPYYDADENVNYLGSFSAALLVNDVQTTASTSETINGRVGDLAAYGTVMASGNKLKFDCRDYGVIMCIASFLPESEYVSNSLDKANTLFEQFDFFTPEFQNIGLEAVPSSEVSLFDPAKYNNVLGYAPRYHMYKTAVDKVFGEFGDSALYLDATIETYKHIGSLRPWVSPRTEYDSLEGYRYLKTFYVSPNVYNDVFGVAVDSSQNTDQFLHNVYFDIKAIRPMSVLGLPQF